MRNRFVPRLALAILVIWARPGSAAAEDHAFTLTMLDKDLSRWLVTDCAVECDGEVLTLKEGNGLVRSLHRVRDFTLEWTYRPLQSDTWDSGVYFRADLPPQGRPWPVRYQINLRKGQEGDLVGDPEARADSLVNPGAWNTMRLTVVGHHAVLDVNGKPAWRTDRIEPLDGYVGFQVEAPQGGPFEIRDVKLTEIGARGLLNGVDLSGWEGAGKDASSCWQVRDGLLVCTGAEGPWLRSVEEYDDFNFRIEYKVGPGGNSGVYVRVPADGNHHGDQSGVEVQILDDAADRYRELKDYQFSASLYAVQAASPRTARPAGAWNLLEIDCRGGSYAITHNGVLVVRADTALAPELAARRLRGFLGLQNHSEEVWFRNARVAPSSQPADAARPVADLLARPVIGSKRSSSELLAHVGSRVAPMPPLSTAEAWNAYADPLRSRILDEVVFRGAARAWRETRGAVEWQEVLEPVPEYRIRKLRFEALPGLWIPALLYEPTSPGEKMPVMLNVNGHDPNGKSAPYKQTRCVNLVRRGIPSLNVEWFGMGQLRSPGFDHGRLNQLELCGAGGIAPFLLAMQRGLDVLLEQPYADPSRVGVAGLSGGGWQTIWIGAMDTRVTLSNPVAGYSGFLTRIAHPSDLGDSEQMPTDMATMADYTHLTAMLAPRHALLTYNVKDDCCFKADHALPPLLEAARPVFALLGIAERLRHHVNQDPGTHNFEKDNREALYRAIRAAFFADSADFSVVDIDCAAEILTAEQLQVAMPESNADFHTIAVGLSQAMPLEPALPETADADAAWRTERTMRLAQTVRFHPEYDVSGRRVAVESWRGHRVTHWKLRVGDAWTVPATEIEPPDAVGTALLVGESGRAALGAILQPWLDRSYRVIAVDPFFWGEQRFPDREYLSALLAATVGDRPLGIQSSQIAGVARWLRGHRGHKVELVAVGPRASLAALVAAACDREPIAGAHLHNGLASLKEVLERDLTFAQGPEYFCFGLLERFDIPQIAAIAATNPLHFHGIPESNRNRLQPLVDYCQRRNVPLTLAP